MLSVLTVVAGIGALNLTVDIKGSNYQLVVQASFPDFRELLPLSLVSANLTVSVGALHHLQIDGLSTSGVAMEMLVPASVTARDLGNNVISSFDTVVLARRLTGKEETSLLEGDIDVTAENELALFNTLKISENDSTFVIEFQYQKDFDVPDVNMLRSNRNHRCCSHDARLQSC